jgi:hypothetical protein
VCITFVISLSVSLSPDYMLQNYRVPDKLKKRIGKKKFLPNRGTILIFVWRD